MVDNQKKIAIIPARGGSKRIPKKNIIDFFGKPLIAWTIEAAISSNLFDRVIVSTDDDEIATISEKYGAEIPFMRDNYSDDYSPISLVTVHALQQLLPEKYNTVVQLMPNCPLRNKSNIINAYNNFQTNNFDFQISCFQFGWMNPWWAYEIQESYTPKPVFEDSMRNRRSQDQPKLYCPTGAIWIAKTERLIKTETFYGDNYKFYPMKWQTAIDIDEYEDLEMAKVIYKTKANVI